MLTIRVLDAKDAEQLNSLRESAYRHRYGDQVDVSALRWNARLDHVLDFGLFENEALISAYRMDRVSDISQAEFLLQIRVDAASPLMNVIYPFALGCRACTRIDRQNHGFHFILRAAAIRFLMKSRASHLVSTFRADNPWTSALKQAGYEIFENPQGWGDFIKSSSPACIGILDIRKHGSRAVQCFGGDEPIAVGDSIGASERAQSWLDSF